jgi:AAHS family 3-hydroxyphenylpropionic acid transporter
MSMARAGPARGLNVGVAVAICGTIAVLEGYDIQAIGVTAAKIGPALHIARREMGWVFAASNIGLLFGAMLGGWIADKVGRKPVLVAAVALFGLFTLATAWAPSYAVLLAARLFTGLGLGAAMPNIMAIASDLTPPERRASVTSMMFCGFPLGGAAAAALAAGLPADFDYRHVFYIGGILPLLILPLMLFQLAETRGEARPAVGESTFGALFGGGRAATSLLLWTVQLPTLLIIYLMVNWLPTLVASRGLGAAAGPMAAVMWNLGGIAGALVLSRLVDRSGPRWPLAAGYAALIAVILALGAVQGFGPVLAASFMVGVFTLGLQYPVYGLIPGYYPPAYRATGAGAGVAAGRVGSILGPLVGGFLPAGQVLPALTPLAFIAGAAMLAVTYVATQRDD